MPQAPARVLQLDLFLSDARTYRDALARDETIRPLLRQERTLAQHSRITGLSYWQWESELVSFLSEALRKRGYGMVESHSR